MADIDVQRRGANIWAWIIGIILAVVLIWVLFAAVGGEEELTGIEEPGVAEEEFGTTEPGPEPGTEGAFGGDQEGRAGAPGDTLGEEQAMGDTAMLDEVDQFTSFVQQEEMRLGLEHETTAQGVQYLASALTALAEETGVRNDTIDQVTNQIEQNAEQLQEETRSQQHADLLRNSLTSAVEVLESIQSQAYPDMTPEDLDQLRQAAMNISPDQLLLDQSEQVKQAFNEAGEALTAFRGQRTGIGAGAS